MKNSYIKSKVSSPSLRIGFSTSVPGASFSNRDKTTKAVKVKPQENKNKVSELGI